jgi:hypothetical protein
MTNYAKRELFINTLALVIETASFLFFTKRYSGKRDPCSNAQILFKKTALNSTDCFVTSQ